MVDTPRQSWDQLPDEPDESYARFCTYRNLGPGRSAQLAARVHGKSKKKGKKGRTPPHTWGVESKAFNWVARATQYDIHHLQQQGQDMARQWIGGLVLAIKKATAKLTDPLCNPKDFLQAAIVLEKFAPYLTPDVLQALQPVAESAGTEIPERSFPTLAVTGRPDPADASHGHDPGPVANGTHPLPGSSSGGTVYPPVGEDTGGSLSSYGPLLDEEDQDPPLRTH